ncbi:aldo/keto reductase [Nonomuraea sp. NPDC049480]|uniref:aldo/keto reductase n=1 Tax=Nonomuraea sp. NPDC049480 TaxID=3364353 RepID=UPI00379C68F0
MHVAERVRRVSAAQVALAWLLGRPAITSLVVGARTSEQLADNLAAADLKLTAEQRARLDEVSRQPLLYPPAAPSGSRARLTARPCSSCTSTS